MKTKLTIFSTLLLILNIIGILSLFTGNYEVTLGCGLFGFIGPNPEKYFLWDKFNILGWFNDTRGGDACGRVVGNFHEHGVDNLKTYKEFAMARKNPVVSTLPTTIIGHCRKASVGGKDSIFAQPIIMTKKDVNMKAIKDSQLKSAIKSLKDTDIVFSGMHNGTIDNYKELAPKYGIPTEDHNDTKVLLTALFYGNYEILSEYIGTAAFVWQNHITHKTYIFKGKSKAWPASLDLTEERPLFCWEIGENNYYFSSLDESLLFIGAVKESIINIDYNIIHIFKNGVRQKEGIPIDRSSASQNKSYYTKPANNTNGYNFNTRNYANHDGYSNDLHYSDGLANRAINGPSTPTLFRGTSEMRPLNKTNIPTINENTKKLVRVFSIATQPIRIQAEKNNQYLSSMIKRVGYNKTRYWMHGGLMHGVYMLNGSGIIPTLETTGMEPTKLYYFVEGLMLDGIHGYNKAIVIHMDFIEALITNPIDATSLEQEFTKDIIKYSKYPAASLTKTTGSQDCYSCRNEKDVLMSLYSGGFQPTFSDRRYVFSKGDLYNISVEPTMKTAVHDLTDMTRCDLYIQECQDEKDSRFTLGYKLFYNANLKNPLSPFQSVYFTTARATDGTDTALLLAHYVRGFVPECKAACRVCTSEETEILHTCIRCPSFENGYEKVRDLIDYNVFAPDGK